MLSVRNSVWTEWIHNRNSVWTEYTVTAHLCLSKAWTAQDRIKQTKTEHYRGLKFQHMRAWAGQATERPWISLVTKQARLVCQGQGRSRAHIKAAQTLETVAVDQIRNSPGKGEARANTSSSSSCQEQNQHTTTHPQESWWPEKLNQNLEVKGCAQNPKSATTKYFNLGAGTRYTKFLDRSNGSDPYNMHDIIMGLSRCSSG